MKRVFIDDDKNLQPASVAHMVDEFLESKGFKTLTEASGEESFKVQGVSRTSEGKRAVLIVVNRIDEGVEVDFKTGEIEKKLFKSGSLISLLGAGALLVEYGRKLDFYEKIESELWRHLDSRL